MPSDNGKNVTLLSPSAAANAFARFWILIRSLWTDSFSDWPRLVFLTTCFATMVGCGVLSLVAYRDRQRQLWSDQRRRFVSRRRSQVPSGTVTSSDEDFENDDDSESSRSTKEARQRSNEESKDYGLYHGIPTFFPFMLRSADNLE